MKDIHLVTGSRSKPMPGLAAGFFFPVAAVLLILLFSPLFVQGHDDRLPEFFDLRKGGEVEAEQVVSQLKTQRIVLVGEHHTNAGHHRAQLAVIRLLHEAGVHVSVGLEMFQKGSQPFLDAWVDGSIQPEDFEKVYYRNWNFPWDLYQPVFEYARENGIPMVGLNVSPEITRQVARDGFSSLSEKQRGALSNISCNIDQEYMDFVREAFGAHAHGRLNFGYFCEAQLVWDSVMAVGSLEYLDSHPDTTMVILAGTGHARKHGIPDQVSKRTGWPVTVILPETPGSIDADTVDANDADYLIRLW